MREIEVVEDVFHSRIRGVKFQSTLDPHIEEYSENVPFYFNYDFVVRHDDGVYSLGKIGFEPLMLPLNGDAQSTLLSFATLFYSHHLTKPTLGNIVIDLNLLSRHFRRELTKEEKSLVEQSWRLKQWKASYALAATWFVDFGKKHSNSFRDIRYVHVYGQEFDKLRNKAIKIGAKDFLDYYINKPQVLFGQ